MFFAEFYLIYAIIYCNKSFLHTSYININVMHLYMSEMKGGKVSHLSVK